MKKFIPAIVAVVLIVIIGFFTIGKMTLEKYSYSNEQADLNEYFGIEGDQLAVVLQDEMLEEKAIWKGNVCYFPYEMVKEYLNDKFYVDKAEKLLLYTTATEIMQVAFGETIETVNGTGRDLGLVPAIMEGDQVYVAAAYVKLYTNLSWDIYDGRVQVYTQWGEKQVAEITKKTNVRVLGGVKSPILRELYAGEQVEILDKMETWCKIKTQDVFIGYVENKYLTNETVVTEEPVTSYVEPEYTTIRMDGKVCLGWHCIGGSGGNITLDDRVRKTKGMNVISPTWFSLMDENGNYESFATKAYVDNAHSKYGLQVWAVLDDFNYANVKNKSVSVSSFLASTASRTRLIENLIAEALRLGLDGINLDFEKVPSASGDDFAQFVRELSVHCRNNELVFSVDNYVPYSFNKHMNRDVQGEVADYVIIMGYDEHYRGSGDPGPVASIDFVKNGIEKTMEEVPKEKIVNGIPFYSLLWKITGADVTDEYLRLDNTQEFLDKVGKKTTWNEETGLEYVEWTGGNTKYKLWAETPKSISLKLNVMRAQDIAGVAVWEITYSIDEAWNLINAYVTAE